RARHVALDAPGGEGLPDEHQPLRLAEGKRPHQHGVDDAPDRAGSRDAERDRRDRDEREPGTAPEAPERELDVQQQLSHAGGRSEARASSADAAKHLHSLGLRTPATAPTARPLSGAEHLPSHDRNPLPDLTLAWAGVNVAPGGVMAQRFKLRLSDGTFLSVDVEGLRAWTHDGAALVQVVGNQQWRP